MGDTGEGRAWLRTRAQLLEAESAATIARRCRAGRYVRVLPGVYAREQPRGIDRCRAVALWRADATFSHTTAAWLYGLIDEPERVHVTLPRQVKAQGPPWLVVHRRDLPGPASWVFGMPVVGRPAAIVQSLPLLERGVAERMVDEHSRTHEEHAELVDACRAEAGGDGIGVARALVRGAVLRSASEAERVLARELVRRRCRLDGNKGVGAFYGDLVDGRSRVIVEVDGREPHSERRVFRKDRRRQNHLLHEGWFVLRFAADDVFDDLDAVATEVVATVRRRRRARRGGPA